MAIRGILLDTNAYAAFKRNIDESLEILRRAPVIGINAVVMGELLSGFALGKYESVNKEELKLFITCSRVKIFSITDNTASYYSRIYINLKRKGLPIPTNDLWIAASALEHNLALYSYDNHFKSIDEITVGKRLKDFKY